MNAMELLADLAQLGVQLEAKGDRLRFFPPSAVTTELAERMKTHKPELLAALHASEPGQGQTTVRCPWCRSTELTTAAGGLACSDCSQRAWLFKGGIITRADVAVTEAQVIDPPPPCPACGGSEFWQTVQGNWRCLACNPPTTARRLRKLAARLKPDGAGPGRSEREL